MAGQKRGAAVLDDPLDRALKFREEGLDRKGLDLLGFCSSNRGRLGINGYHVHKVAWSCKTHTVKLVRYKQVDIVRVPQSELDAFRQYNKVKCDSDALMPKFSSVMRFGCLTKTHFCHANKLSKDGNRTLFNEGKIPVAFHDDGREGEKIREEGVLTCVYGEGLWNDPEAMEALMNADNDDADIEMGEDEIQAQGRIESAISAVETTHAGLSLDAVLAEMRRSGLRSYTEEQTKAFVQFRLSVTPIVAQCFRACVFHAISGRVTVHPNDYACVSSLDVRAMWVKVAIILRQYMATLLEHYPPGVPTTLLTETFAGRTSTQARKLPQGIMKQLAQETTSLVRLDNATTTILRKYAIKNPSLDKVMAARTQLFSNVGKLALKIGAALERAVALATGMHKECTSEQRTAAVEATMKGQVAEIEHKYRAALVDAGTYLESALPPAAFPRDERAAGASPGQPHHAARPAVESMPSVAVPSLAAGGDGREFGEVVGITEHQVRQRLRIEKLPQKVGLRDLTFLKEEIEAAPSSSVTELGANPLTPTGSSVWNLLGENSLPPTGESKGDDMPGEGDDAANKPAPTSDKSGGADLYAAELRSLHEEPTYESGWRGCIMYGGLEYNVDSDVLLPPKEVPAEAPAPKTLDLRSFNWERMAPGAIYHLAAIALDQAYTMTYDAVQGVVVTLIGDAREMPCKLRVQALKDFKIGDLLLTPYCSMELPALLVSAREPQMAKKYEKPDRSQMDETCLPRVFLKVLGKDKVKKKLPTAQGAVPAETFYVNSPRFWTRDVAQKRSIHDLAEEMSPFWAINRTTSTSDVNMQLKSICFEVPSIIPMAEKMPSPIKKTLWSAVLQCAVNTKKIHEGDILHISMMNADTDFVEDDPQE